MNTEMSSQTRTITIRGVELEVTYTHTKGCSGLHDSLGGVAGAGPALTPDEPSGIDIEQVLVVNSLDCIFELLKDSVVDTILDKIEELDKE